MSLDEATRSSAGPAHRPAAAADSLEAPRAIRSTWPRYEDDEIAAVTDVLRSGRVNALVHGDRTKAFESAYAAQCDREYAIAVANGTLALELALRALGIGRGDEVIVPARSFMATAACVVASGATPVFADIEPDSQGLSATTISAAATARTKAVIPVHLAGYPCAMDEIADLCTQRGYALIEDCAQANGATYRDRPVGSFGDAAAFSFCTDKILSTGGEGGMLVLRDANVWDRAWSYKDHGKSYALTHQPPGPPGFRYIHTSFGSNFRMTEMQAAIGLRQLAKLPGWTAARGQRAAILSARLAPLPVVRLPETPSWIGHAYYKFYAFIRPERLKPDWDRARILAEANAAGIPCQTGSCPEIYRETACVEAGLGPAAPLATARMLGETSLLLPVDQTISLPDVTEMGDRLARILARASA